ncbi:MAG: sensor histidine kinase [Leptolyngbyaceae cyanobacterium]
MLNRFTAWWHTYFISPAPSPNVLGVYQQWRHQFLYQRLRLLIWLLAFVLAAITVFELWLWRVKPEDVGVDNFVINGIVGLAFALGLRLQTHAWGRRYQGVIFWLVSATVNLTLLVAGVWAGNIGDAEMTIWSMVFLAQSTLVPVRWKLHLRSHLTLLVPLAAVVTVAFFTVESTTERSDVLFGTIAAYIYLVWVCIVANLGVYLYERLRYQEFEARQEVQTFLHAVSHDLRNPVTGTQLLIKSLLDHSEETVTMPRAVLEQMQRSGERQLVLINSLLEAHNNNLKGLTLQRQNVNLFTLVEAVCHELAPQLTEAKIVLHNQISPELPTIAGDGTQLWRVFHNLIVNALNHNPPGIAIWVNASELLSAASATKPYIRCTVRDNGVGMTSEQCVQLFNLYSHGHRRRHLSIGLGLHIAQQIIHAHGGTLGVESEVNRGSIFWLTLPLVSPSLPHR